MELLRSNPYGIQPVGNRAFATSTNYGQRIPGLGTSAALDDGLWLSEMCSFFSGLDLSFLSVCSKFLYAYCHYDELWKKLVLARQGVPFVFAGSWKETFTGISHSPLRVRVYSDVLYQPFWCSALRIPRKWIEFETVPRVSIESLSVEKFVTTYEQPNRPVVLTNCHKHQGGWAAYKKWNRDYLLATAGPTTLFNAAGQSLPLSSYLLYSDQQKDDNPIYLFDKHFVDNTPQFGSDYVPLSYFSKERDLFNLLEGTAYRPDHRWLIVGPKRSGSRFHVDPNGTSAWNAVIKGSKKWILFPPHSVPPGVHPSADGGDVTSPVSLTEWFRGFYDQAREDRNINGMMECVVGAGETIFVPSGWYHLVINLDFTIAVTQNYVSTSNLINVMSYLSRSPKLISGVAHDKRPHLRSTFETALRKCRPEAYQLLVDAKAERLAQQSRKRERTLTTTVKWTELTRTPKNTQGVSSFSSSLPSSLSSTSESTKATEVATKERGTMKKSSVGFSFGFDF